MITKKKKKKKTRICSKCKKKKAYGATTSYCTPCMTAYMHKKYHEQDSSVKANSIAYYERNREAYAKRSKAWDKAHPDRYKKYYAANREACLARTKAWYTAKKASLLLGQ